MLACVQPDRRLVAQPLARSVSRGVSAHVHEYALPVRRHVVGITAIEPGAELEECARGGDVGVWQLLVNSRRHEPVVGTDVEHLVSIATPPRRSPSVHGYPTASFKGIRESGRGDRIRTCDILLPKQARYQAAPRPARTIMPYRPLCRGPLSLFWWHNGNFDDVLESRDRASAIRAAHRCHIDR
jgi:hypothetical protein